jgi:small subunit ribosomal protein S18
MSEEKAKNQNEEVTKPTLEDVPDVSNIEEEEENTGFGGDKKKRRRRKKIVLNLKCPLCEAGIKNVTYKDVYQLKKFTSVRGKIISTEKSGVCHKHQNQIKRAIKRARFLALLPYVAKDN